MPCLTVMFRHALQFMRKDLTKPQLLLRAPLQFKHERGKKITRWTCYCALLWFIDEFTWCQQCGKSTFDLFLLKVIQHFYVLVIKVTDTGLWRTYCRGSWAVEWHHCLWQLNESSQQGEQCRLGDRAEPYSSSAGLLGSTSQLAVFSFQDLEKFMKFFSFFM